MEEFCWSCKKPTKKTWLKLLGSGIPQGSNIISSINERFSEFTALQDLISIDVPALRGKNFDSVKEGFLKIIYKIANNIKQNQIWKCFNLEGSPRERAQNIYAVDQHRILKTNKWWDLHYASQKSSSPKISKIYEYLQVVPLTTVECERSFSRMNLIKTCLRNNLEVSTLSDLMNISLNGPDVRGFPYEEAQIVGGEEREKVYLNGIAYLIAFSS